MRVGHWAARRAYVGGGYGYYYHPVGRVDDAISERVRAEALGRARRMAPRAAPKMSYPSLAPKMSSFGPVSVFIHIGKTSLMQPVQWRGVRAARIYPSRSTIVIEFDTRSVTVNLTTGSHHTRFL